MRPFQIHVVLIYFLTYTFHRNRSYMLIFLEEYEIFLVNFSLFKDFAIIWSNKFATFTSFPLSTLQIIVFRFLLFALRSHSYVVPPPPPILKDDELAFDVERILAHEVRGSRTRPQKFYLIKWLGYELEHNSWESKKILSSKVLKEYCDIVACSQERLTALKVLRVLMYTKRSIEKAIINKSKLMAQEFKIVYHLSRDAQS